MGEICFDINARDKSVSDRMLMKNHFITRTVLASGFKRSETTIFFSQNPKELFGRLCLTIQEKQTGNATTEFDNEIFAKNDELLEYKNTHHKKKFLKNLILYKIRLFFKCDYIR